MIIKSSRFWIAGSKICWTVCKMIQLAVRNRRRMRKISSLANLRQLPLYASRCERCKTISLSSSFVQSFAFETEISVDKSAKLAAEITPGWLPRAPTAPSRLDGAAAAAPVGAPARCRLATLPAPAYEWNVVAPALAKCLRNLRFANSKHSIRRQMGTSGEWRRRFSPFRSSTWANQGRDRKTDFAQSATFFINNTHAHRSLFTHKPGPARWEGERRWFCESGPRYCFKWLE